MPAASSRLQATPQEHAIHSGPDFGGSEVSSVQLEEEELGAAGVLSPGWTPPEEDAWEEDASMASTMHCHKTPHGRTTAPKAKTKGNRSSVPETEEVTEDAVIPAKGTKAKNKAAMKAATTGELADFPMLGLTKSWDPPMNCSWITHQRILVHKWKVFLLQLRMRQAMEQSRLPWKRQPAWLARLYATELAAMWGHFGSCVKTLRQPKGAVMFR